MLNNDEKINKLLADKEFFKKITSMKTAEEVVQAFKEKGAEISAEEVKEIGSMINEVVEKLKEENLESVSGGKRDNLRQFMEGCHSGFYGPGHAYSVLNPDTKPENKGQKVSRYAGIAVGVASTCGVLLPLTWTAGAIWGAVENKKSKKK